MTTTLTNTCILNFVDFRSKWCLLKWHLPQQLIHRRTITSEAVLCIPPANADFENIWKVTLKFLLSCAANGQRARNYFSCCCSSSSSCSPFGSIFHLNKLKKIASERFQPLSSHSPVHYFTNWATVTLTLSRKKYSLKSCLRPRTSIGGLACYYSKYFVTRQCLFF